MNYNNKEERKILVTGATGTVGSEVVKRLGLSSIVKRTRSNDSK